MLDGHLRFAIQAFEHDLHMRQLPGCKGRLPPTERQACAWLPCGDAADLESLAVWQGFGESAAKPRLESQQAGRARRELEKFVWPPPQADLAGKNLERVFRRGGDAQGDENA